MGSEHYTPESAAREPSLPALPGNAAASHPTLTGVTPTCSYNSRRCAPSSSCWPTSVPTARRAVLALVLLTTLVVLDLAIPRLIQRIIDQGINAQNQAVVIQTALLMLGISVLSTLIAIGNNIFSVQVGEGVARDLREALFVKIQSFSFGNLDRRQTGELMVRLTSDVSAVQRLVQISLRIGTRAPLLMIGSLILMISTSPSLALTMLPLLLVTSVLIVFFIVRMEPLFRQRPAEARPAQHRPAGEHRRRAPGQGLRARRFRGRALRGGQRGFHRPLGAGDAVHVEHVARR